MREQKLPLASRPSSSGSFFRSAGLQSMPRESPHRIGWPEVLVSQSIRWHSKRTTVLPPRPSSFKDFPCLLILCVINLSCSPPETMCHSSYGTKFKYIFLNHSLDICSVCYVKRAFICMYGTIRGFATSPKDWKNVVSPLQMFECRLCSAAWNIYTHFKFIILYFSLDYECRITLCFNVTPGFCLCNLTTIDISFKQQNG